MDSACPMTERRYCISNVAMLAMLVIRTHRNAIINHEYT
jgi:hypothetical protein